MLTGTRLALAAVAMFSVGAMTAQEALPRNGATGTGVIAGIVVLDDEPSRPLARTTLQLRGPRDPVVTMTDDAGRFEFRFLPAGRFTLVVMKPDHVPVVYGSGQRHGPVVMLVEGQQLTDLIVRLERGAAISGRIVDDRGEPAASHHVIASTPILLNGLPQLDAGSFVGGATTNERGLYRLHGLLAGSYVVSASVPAPRTPGSPVREPAVVRFFHPGTRDSARATVVSISAGEERTLTDLVVTRFAAGASCPEEAGAPRIPQLEARQSGTR